MKILGNSLLVKEAQLAVRQLITSIFAWAFGYPLTFLFKRQADLIVVIGRQGRVFADNSKYFFIASTQHAAAGERVIYFTNERCIRDALIDAGSQAVLHPSWRSLYLLLRCSHVIMDWADWSDYGGCQLSRGARRIQIWHGAPLKQIELDVYRKRLAGMPAWMRGLLRIQKKLIGRYPLYDTVAATSQGFIDDAFKRCFKAKRFIASGYPRNDILLGWPERSPIADALLHVNVDQKALVAVQKAKFDGQWVCLYVPTFRKDMTDPFSGSLDLARLSELAVSQNLLVVLKLHPLMQGRYSIDRYPNLLEYEPLCDVYPLMAQCDILITDYSSIFFDFLLLDRPVVFFAPDLDDYIRNDRDMYFDYCAMTPGAKCYHYADLERQIIAILENDGDDGYVEMRAAVRKYTHDFIDNQAGSRLLKMIRHSS